jgi:hypothetical protein
MSKEWLLVEGANSDELRTKMHEAGEKGWTLASMPIGSYFDGKTHLIAVFMERSTWPPRPPESELKAPKSPKDYFVIEHKAGGTWIAEEKGLLNTNVFDRAFRFPSAVNLLKRLGLDKNWKVVYIDPEHLSEPVEIGSGLSPEKKAKDFVLYNQGADLFYNETINGSIPQSKLATRYSLKEARRLNVHGQLSPEYWEIMSVANAEQLRGKPQPPEGRRVNGLTKAEFVQAVRIAIAEEDEDFMRHRLTDAIQWLS